MRESAAWSATRVPAAARPVLSRLGVFDGSFALDMAVEVASEGGMAPEMVRAAITTIVEHGSLVRANDCDVGGQVRFLMPATTGGYALGPLPTGEVAALRR